MKELFLKLKFVISLSSRIICLKFGVPSKTASGIVEILFELSLNSCNDFELNFGICVS